MHQLPKGAVFPSAVDIWFNAVIRGGSFKWLQKILQKISMADYTIILIWFVNNLFIQLYQWFRMMIEKKVYHHLTYFDDLERTTEARYLGYFAINKTRETI